MHKLKKRRRIKVICRIGSLEICAVDLDCDTVVICRIGSLEKIKKQFDPKEAVICRIGSLEICAVDLDCDTVVICRIGSLEIQQA